MKTKRISIGLLLSMFLLLFPGIGIGALENNSELNESYNYTPQYEAVYSPEAYSCEKVIGHMDIGVEQPLSPVDVFTKGEYVYIVCNKTNAVYKLDQYFNLVKIINEIKGDLAGPHTLNAPEGVFVDDEENLYIADTQNQRILLLDKNGDLLQEIIDPEIKVLGEVVTFFPSKIVVDQAKRIYVVGKNINRGIIELSPDGEFNTFIGAPKVKVSFSDVIKRNFMTKEQLRRMEKFIPTEYNNIAIDSAGFLYGTIGSVDAGAISQAAKSSPDETPDNAKPVLKLSPSGEDILFRRGNVPIIGELDFKYGYQSFINDVTVRSDGIYYILDQRQGKVFGYDMYGNLLYVFGSLGKQNGRFSSPSGISCFGDKVIVVDQISGKINVFAPTEYGELLNAAVKLDYDGKYEEAASIWKTLVQKNSNLFLAYTGIGKMYQRDKDYENAMMYFKTAQDRYYYDQAKEKVRKEWSEDYFPLIFIAAVAFILILIYRSFLKKKRKGDVPVKKKQHAFIEQIKYSFYLLTHPIDGFWELKYAHKGSLKLALLIMLFFFVSVLFKRQLTAWQFNSMDPTKLNILSEFFTTIGPYVIWCVSTWCVTSLMEGQGTMKDIVKATCYSLVPLLIANFLGTVISNVIVGREYMIYAIIMNIGLYWTLGLIFLSVVTIHQYSVSKALWVTILSLLGMVIIACLGILLFYLVQQLIGFGMDVLKEYFIRIAE